jgi:hypothetical protein
VATFVVTVRSVGFVGRVRLMHGGELATLLAAIPPLLLALRLLRSLPQFCCGLSWRLHDKAPTLTRGSNELVIVTDRQISPLAGVTVIGRAISCTYSTPSSITPTLGTVHACRAKQFCTAQPTRSG